MGVIGFICSLLALTPEQEAVHHQLMVDYGIEPMTSAEEARYQADEDSNYVANLRGHAHRSFHYSNDGLTLHWQETVMDQHGHEHVVDSGSHYVGFSGWGGTLEEIQGEVVEDKPFIVRVHKKGWFS